MMGEGLFNQALDDCIDRTNDWRKVKIMRNYSSLLMKNRIREAEAKRIKEEADSLASSLKPWHEKLDHFYIPSI